MEAAAVARDSARSVQRRGALFLVGGRVAHAQLAALAEALSSVMAGGSQILIAFPVTRSGDSLKLDCKVSGRSQVLSSALS